MNQFEHNPQQIGLNSRQLSPYQNVYVIEADGSWSETPKVLLGYMVVEDDVCAICRDTCAETRVCHWGTWCPQVEPEVGSDQRERINIEEQARLDEAADNMVEKVLAAVHGADDPSLHADAPSHECSFDELVGVDLGVDEIINGCDEDCKIPTKYVVFGNDGHIVGVYVDESYAEAHMKDCLGRVEGWVGDEVVCTCEFIYSADALLDGVEAVPTGTLWTRYERESLNVD